MATAGNGILPLTRNKFVRQDLPRLNNPSTMLQGMPPHDKGMLHETHFLMGVYKPTLPITPVPSCIHIHVYPHHSQHRQCNSLLLYWLNKVTTGKLPLKGIYNSFYQPSYKRISPSLNIHGMNIIKASFLTNTELCEPETYSIPIIQGIHHTCSKSSSD